MVCNYFFTYGWKKQVIKKTNLEIEQKLLVRLYEETLTKVY
jgi:hypothetical protein